MKKVYLRVALSFFAAIFGVVGCGQTGPLYLPSPAVESPVKKTVATSRSSVSATASSAQAVSARASSAH